MLVAGVFQGTISIGTAIVACLVLGVAGWFATKYKLAELAQHQATAAQDAAAEWRDNYMAERARAEDLQNRYDEQRALKHEAITRARTAELRTDLTAVIEGLTRSNDALVAFHNDFLEREARFGEIRQALQETEARLVARLETMTRVQEAIVTRLELGNNGV